MNKRDPQEDVKTRSEPLQFSQSPSKARHKRFDDEDFMVQPLPTYPDAAQDATKQLVHPEEEDKAESDNEAPETITASTGLDQARQATEEAHKAIKR